MTRIDDREDVDYQMQAEVVGTDEKVNSRDEADYSTLVRVQKTLKEALVHYNSLDSIDLTQKEKLTPDQQIAVNQRVVVEIRAVLDSVDESIKSIK